MRKAISNRSISQEVRIDMDSALEAEIKASLVDGKLLCPVAFKIAKKMKVAPKKVGEAANRLEIKIAGCQLGCFP